MAYNDAIRPHINSNVDGLGPLAFSDSELISENINLFRHFGRTPWTGYCSVTRSVPTQGTKIHKNTSMPRAGFEPAIPVFERFKKNAP
jgi:hypothetical protein